MTLLENSTSILGVVNFVDDASGGWFIGLILLSVFFILFYSLRPYGTSSALAAASFPTFVIAILLKAAGLVNFTFVILFFILTLAATIFRYIETVD